MNFRELLRGNVLSRVFMSASDSNKCMAIFTASRSENSESQNDKGNKEIRSELKRLKVGYRIAKDSSAPIYTNTSLLNFSTGQIVCFLMILAAVLGYVALYFYNKKKIKTN